MNQFYRSTCLSAILIVLLPPFFLFSFFFFSSIPSLFSFPTLRKEGAKERERERKFEENEEGDGKQTQQGEKRGWKEMVNEEDRDSRWLSMEIIARVWWIMARTAKATVMVALGTLARDSKDRL